MKSRDSKVHLVSSWQNLLLETSVTVESTSVVVLTTLPGGVSLRFSHSSSITTGVQHALCKNAIIKNLQKKSYLAVMVVPFYSLLSGR